LGEGPRVPQGAERRISPRYTYDCALQIEWGSATLRGMVRDISDKGMFIETPDPLWIGAAFGAIWELELPLHLDCVVRRIEPGRGMGVQYSVADSAGLSQLSALLESLAQR
jgi:hypothetical protein